MNTEIIDDVDTSECAQLPEIELSNQQREAIEFAVKDFSAFRESAPQWLYTAVTRAKELVIWVK